MRKMTRNKYRPEFARDHLFDYKDPSSLGRFIGDGGKIVPSRISKLSLAQQKKVAAAIKKARSLALIANGMDAYDHHHRSEAVSPVPFEI